MYNFYILLTVFLLAGCGSTKYTITTNPIGADVEVNKIPRGMSPIFVEYSNKRSKSVPLRIRKDGYKTIDTMLGPSGGVINFNLEKFEANSNTEIIIIDNSSPEPRFPSSFVRTLEPSWASIQLSKNITYLTSWNHVLDIFIRKFDIAFMEKRSGYIRTNWIHTSTGTVRADYRVRVTAKFNVEKTKVDIKTEANYQQGNGWVQGSDTDLLQTIKADVMGAVGRITR
jgi:hypothetical protein